MKLEEVRLLFLDYFKSKGHSVVPSASLVPHNDPTLLFTNAGMVPFKNVFLGTERRDYKIATSVQKCVRAGGKHNDLEQVGKTRRHHTFFEMLGNFSFGDYFKKEAIEYAWEYITKTLKLAPERLTVSVYKDDQESFDLWNKHMGIPQNKIYQFGEKDNFWQMADTGPCGPCTEIFYDFGAKAGCGKSTCETGCSCDRYVEIWNLVFMQYNKDATGKLSPLPKPCVDTGMGLERVTAALQGVLSNYETDHFQKLIQKIEKITQKKYSSHKTAFHVIADHIRAVTFLIGDGVMPSNEGRGYVLRRILRRALRYGHMLGQKKPFLYKISEQLIHLMQQAYPDLKEKKNFIEKIILTEEEKFLETLQKGISLFLSHVHAIRKAKAPLSSPHLARSALAGIQTILPGDIVFKLYDTFGFPLDLTKILAEENEISIDEQGFEELLKFQKERAKGTFLAQSKFSPLYAELGKKKIKSVFEGYKTLKTTSTLLYIVKDNKGVTSAQKGEKVELIFNITPFYSQAGGQVGDKGEITKKGVTIHIEDTFSPLPNLIVHKGQIQKGTIKLKQKYELTVDSKLRFSTALNHTATHLLHHALRHILGDHVKQAGSLVEPSRLRFDYTHFKPTTPLEIQQIEDFINTKIGENSVTKTQVLDYEAALKKGAIAIFEEKYGNRVRCVQLGTYSKELCGGTHAASTGAIRLFKIISDAAIGSGIRRMEAVTGQEAFIFLNQSYETIQNICERLKIHPKDLESKIENVLERNKTLEKELVKHQAQKQVSFADELLRQVKMIHGISVLRAQVPGANPQTLRQYSDFLRQKLKSGIFALGSVQDNRAFILVGVTDDLTDKYNASELIKPLASAIGGSGGGKAHLAQAGGTQPENLSKALEKLYAII